MTSRTCGFLVSLEGISGSGKTHFATQLGSELAHDKFIVLSELSDRTSEHLDGLIIRALRHSRDRFFRMNLPLSETFLLLALKMYDYEATIAPALAAGLTVVEDRSIDTIAVYQAIMICSEGLEERVSVANEIYEIAAKWRRPPDLTFLLVDNFEKVIRRAASRAGVDFHPDEIEVLRAAEALYSRYAQEYPNRIVTIDQAVLTNDQVIERITTGIRRTS